MSSCGEKYIMSKQAGFDRNEKKDAVRRRSCHMRQEGFQYRGDFMSIILGYLCLLCFLMLLVKAVTRKLHLKKADVFFMQAHKYISAAILIIAVLHFIFVFPMIRVHHIGVFITGALTAAAMVLLIVLCHTITKNKHLNLLVHRLLTLVMALCIIGHIWIYFAE